MLQLLGRHRTASRIPCEVATWIVQSAMTGLVWSVYEGSRLLTVQIELARQLTHSVHAKHHNGRTEQKCSKNICHIQQPLINLYSYGSCTSWAKKTLQSMDCCEQLALSTNWKRLKQPSAAERTAASLLKVEVFLNCMHACASGVQVDFIFSCYFEGQQATRHCSCVSISHHILDLFASLISCACIYVLFFLAWPSKLQ